MHVLVIIADTLRADYCGCYGNRWVRTPNIDALAAQGARFDSFYAASFPTRPMRQDLHTGRYTFTYMSWGSRWAGDEKRLAQEMQARGYATALVGDTPSNGGFEPGFDHFQIIPGQNADLNPTGRGRRLPARARKLRTPISRVQQILRNEALWRGEQDRYVAQTMRAAGAWLESQYHSARPVFLMVDTFDPHEPWDPPQHYVDLYDPDYVGDELFEPAYEPAGYATEAEIRHMRCLYAAEVTLVDHWVGCVLDTLERLRMAEETLVVLMSDHGFYHGEHGLIGKVQLTRRGVICRRYPLYRTISQAPLIVRVPGVVAGRAIAGLCQPPDIMPTILDFARPGRRGRRAAAPTGMQGRSLAPMLAGKDVGAQEVVTSYTFAQDAQVRSPSTLRTRAWSYIYGGDEMPSELYDVRADPEETRNLLPERRDQAQRLHARYVDFLERIGCPREHLDRRRQVDPKPRRRLPRQRLI
jgi:arylsulfatase A-like enzyme